MPKLEDLTLKIKQTGSVSTTNLTKLSDAMHQLSAAVKSFPKNTDNLSELNSAVKSINENKAEALAKVATAIGKLAETSDKVKADAAGNIAAIGAALEQMIDGVDSSRLDSISESLQKFKDSISAINGVRGRVAEAVSASANAATPRMAEAPTGVEEATGESAEAADTATSAYERYYKVLQSIAEHTKVVGKGLATIGNAAKNVVVGVGKLAGHLGSAVWDRFKTKITGIVGAMGNLVHSFARIAMYRALRTAIKAITTGFAEGIKHLYEWSRVMDSTFKNSMDSLATSAHYLRDSLGAMVSPLIDAIAPAVEFLVEKFVSLLNVVNQFIATFTGASTWRRAVRTPTEYASGMDDAAKSTKKATEAQKKLNKALMDFDEIHLITTSTSGGSNPSSPSGSGGGGEDYGTHFVEEPIADWIQAIKDAINNGDWYGAGKLLADKLNSVLDQWDARAWGQKLGQKIENGLKFFLGFMDNFHWEDLGAKLGQALGGIFDKVSGEDIGNAIIAPLKAGIKIAKGFFNEPGTKQAFEEMGVAAYTAINGIFNKDFAEDVAGAISGAINDAIAFLKTAVVGKEQIDPITGEVFISGGIKWGDIGKNLVKSLFDTIGSIRWDDLGTVAANIFTGIVTAIGEGISYAATHIEQIAGAIKDFAMAFFKGIWEWFWPSVKEFLFGEHYTAESANDRPNAPVVTGQGAQTTEQLQQELSDTKQGVEEAYGALSNFANLWGWLGKTPVTPIVYATEIEKATAKANAIKKKLDEVAKGTYKPTITYAEKGYTTVTKHLGDIAKTITVPVKYKVSAYTSSVNKSGKTVETKLSKTQLQKVLDLRAAGGFPDQGSLFVAGEVPGQAEMVGNINGKTGVASGKEITGISDAVYNTGETEAALLREQNSLLRQLLAKKSEVTLAPNVAAGRWVSQSQAAYARATGG